MRLEEMEREEFVRKMETEKPKAEKKVVEPEPSLETEKKAEEEKKVEKKQEEAKEKKEQG